MPGRKRQAGPTPPRARRRTPFAAVLAANTVSTAGTSLTLIGVPWFVLQTTGSAGRAGVVAFCATLPIIVSALAAGPLVDRLGRRRVAIGSDLLCAFAVAAIPLLHRAGLLEFWALCALVAVSGLARTPGDTARYVLLPDLAEAAGTTLARAAGLLDAVARGSRMAGAALAGVLIALTGPAPVLLLDAATFGISALILGIGLRGFRAAEPDTGREPVSLRTYRSELREGYAYLLGDRLLLGIVLLVMLMNGTDQGWGAVLLPVHAERSLGGAPAIGLLTALFGAGGLTGALLYGAYGARFSRRRVLGVCAVLSGAPRFLVAATTGSVAPLAVTMVCAGVAAGSLNPILSTVIYERVPDALRSRVSGALTAGCEPAMPVGGLAAGLLVDGAGVRGALLLTGGLFVPAALGPLVFPVWREMDAEPGAGEASPPSPAVPPASPVLSSSGRSRPGPGRRVRTPRP